MNEKSVRTAIHKKAPGRRIILLLGLAFIIIVALLIAYPMVMYRTAAASTVRIPAGATEKNVTDTLSKYYGNKFASKVMSLSHMARTDWSKRHGAYDIAASTNPIGVFRRIARGGQTPQKVTINGFRGLDLLCSRIGNRMEFSADTLRSLLSDPKVTSIYGLTPKNAMALFIDDTYDVYWSAAPMEFIDKIGANYLAFWNDTRRQKAARLGLSPAEVMTVASIADEETNAASEKGRIGRLYINRLDKGMRLQADPTVRFALNDFTIRRVNRNHLSVNSPYNTYTHAGLPPGPIRTTSKASVDAILDSKPSADLYMCAKEDFSGTHNFAPTYDEHMINARKYQTALDARGIR